MSLHKQFNPNPCGCRVGDCTIRAICKATGFNWSRVYCALSAYGLSMHDMPSANRVWGQYLRDLGFHRWAIEKDCTVADFCRDHPEGTYILAIDAHVVCAVDGFYYDTWDSGQETPIFYWAKE